MFKRKKRRKQVLREINREIIQAGYFYNATTNEGDIRIYGEDFCQIIPETTLSGFTSIFPEIDWSEGNMIHALIGRYVRLVVADDGKIIAIKHITKEYTYVLDAEIYDANNAQEVEQVPEEVLNDD